MRAEVLERGEGALELEDADLDAADLDHLAAGIGERLGAATLIRHLNSQVFYLRMILSENRSTLFGIMR